MQARRPERILHRVATIRDAELAPRGRRHQLHQTGRALGRHRVVAFARFDLRKRGQQTGIERMDQRNIFKNRLDLETLGKGRLLGA